MTSTYFEAYFLFNILFFIYLKMVVGSLNQTQENCEIVKQKVKIKLTVKSDTFEFKT